MKDNTARLVLGSLLQSPGKIAIGDDALDLSRAALMANVLSQAQAFLSAGLRADQFVVLFCDRGPCFWTELLATWVVGAKPICVEAKISDAHAHAIRNMTDVAVMIGGNDETSAEFADLKRISSTFDATLSTENLRECFDTLPFANHDVMPEMAGLIFTSGTTGLPKGVPLTHRALAQNALATAQRLMLKADDRLMIATPFRFISSISHLLVTLLSGASFFGIERPMMAKDLLGALLKLKITAFGGSPFHMQFIAMAGQNRLPDLRWAMSSGDHLRPAMIEKLADAFDSLELHVVYGMAELGGRFCELPPDLLPAKIGSVGFPINGFELTVRRESGSICDVGEIGEIFVTGHLGFAGYYRNDTANMKALGPLGFRNGDKGYTDADGCVFLSGRADSVFKRAGLKVSAQVITDALMQFDGVRDAFTASEEDEFEGHVPVCYINWADRGEVPSDQLKRFLRSHIPVNHIPARFFTLPEIPRTGSGKVDRRKLAECVALANADAVNRS